MTTTTLNASTCGPTIQRNKPTFLSWVFLAIAARRQRANLSKLDERFLNDIGLTRADVEAETARPAWDVPSNWLR